MKVVLVPFGSSGDVHPFVGLGLALRERGHRVVFLTIDHFLPLIRSHGFEVRDYGESGQFEKAIADPRLWHPTRSLGVVAESMLKGIRPVYDLIASELVPGETVVAAGSLAVGARVARETLGVPLATVHLSPSILRSVFDTPIVGNVRMPRWWPRRFKSGMYRLMDVIVDRHLAAGINTFRAELGLAPMCRVMHEWWNSPDLVLGMFPEWFAPPQPDWPPQVVAAGFPLYDEAEATPLSTEVERFLHAGPPPILFAPGSAMTMGHRFFAESADACARLGARGVFVTRYPDQIPRELPPGVEHFAYVPFSQILPRCAAFVHHGGIGSTAQGLAAGVPHLVRPLAHDQYDNAARLLRLGVGRSLLPKRYRGATAASMLRALMGSASVASAAREIAARLALAHPREIACDAIERLARPTR